MNRKFDKDRVRDCGVKLTLKRNFSKTVWTDVLMISS